MHFTPLPPALYFIILVMVIVYLGLVEFGKHFFYRSLRARPRSTPTPPRPARHHVNRRIRWFHAGAGNDDADTAPRRRLIP